MGMMKRLWTAGQNEERWAVLPVLAIVRERKHEYTGTHRLMENIGKGRWVERKTGSFKEMAKEAGQNNKEGYITPIKEEEQTERSRFSVMERVRFK